MYGDYTDFDEDRAIDSQSILDEFNRKLNEQPIDYGEYEDFDDEDDYKDLIDDDETDLFYYL